MSRVVASALAVLAIVGAGLLSAVVPAAAVASAPTATEPGPSRSAAPTTSPRVQPRASLIDIEDEVMCVSCNVALNIAESPQASAQRAEIQRLVEQGLTKDEIKDRLVVEYGRNVLAQPDEDGFGLAAYLVPIVVGALGIALLVLLIPRWRRRATAAPGLSSPTPATAGGPAGGPVDADAQRRLDAELARFDR